MARPTKKPSRNISLRLRAGGGSMSSQMSETNRGNAPPAYGRRPWWRRRRTLVATGIFWLLVLLVVLSATGWFGTTESHLAQSFYKWTANNGLKVEEVYITGRHHAGADEINGALGITRDQPILSIDLPAAHKALLDIPWIARARIERHLPNIIYVEIVERIPFARWQFQQQTALIDRTGVVLTRDNAESYSSLPLVVGAAANSHADDILDEIQAAPDFARSLKAAIRVSDRRWDLRLQNGMTLRLPEIGMQEALQRLENLWRTTDIATRGVKIIDARLPDRIIVDEAKPGDKVGDKTEAGTEEPLKE